jgi:hypothetical protein
MDEEKNRRAREGGAWAKGSAETSPGRARAASDALGLWLLVFRWDPVTGRLRCQSQASRIASPLPLHAAFNVLVV